jgi:light-regulated signal transduction histidine kinase (bacteriophytochrome)
MLFLGDTREESLDKIKRTLSGELWEVVELPILRKDGEIRIALWNSANVYAPDGTTITTIIAQGQDITERKQAEQRLKRSNESLEQFAYVASHDLQEPLRIIASYSQLLERRYKDKLDQDADDFIEFIVDAADRMQKLITDLLVFSRVGSKDVAPGRVDSTEVIRKVIAAMSATIEENKAAVTYERLPVLIAPEISFTQIFQNLLGNALKFRSPEPPKIHVAATEHNNEWIFSVRDNGIGIEPQYKERIFQIFQRLHSKQEYPGTGIGLSICKKIVENWGGRIWVESELGKGSTFFFTIPTERR